MLQSCHNNKKILAGLNLYYYLIVINEQNAPFGNGLGGGGTVGPQTPLAYFRATRSTTVSFLARVNVTLPSLLQKTPLGGVTVTAPGTATQTSPSVLSPPVPSPPSPNSSLPWKSRHSCTSPATRCRS